MTQEEKQKIKEDFEKRFPNTESEVKNYGEFCALRSWLLDTVDKAIKDKLEAVEEAVKEMKVGHEVHLVQSETDKDQELGYNIAISDVLEIINKHK